MAELALGLTKTVVQGALSRIQGAIEEEEKLKEGVQQDLEFITGEFQMMQSFLKVANKERARKNEVVRAWVRQLRDLAFDVEDWVEFVAHLEKDESWCSCACGWRLVPSWAVPRCLEPPRDLDVATAEMKLLKARVHDVSQRNTRYNLFSSRDDDDSGLDSNSKAVVPTGSDLSSTLFQILRQTWKDHSYRLRKAAGLPKLITSEVVGNDLQVIWLWESGDACYASELIHKAYQDKKICESFKLCAWVKIMHPFNLQAFLNTLAAQLVSVDASHHHQATCSDGLTSTAELIQQATKDQRYLVVLEQVSDLVEWNTIRKYLPDNEKGSRIVVSTQNLRRAILCTGMPYLVQELGSFTEGRPPICAFYQKAAAQSVSDMDRLIRKIKHGSVISVYGYGLKKSGVVKRSYLRIRRNQRILQQGVRFNTFNWVPVGHGDNLVDISRRLHMALDNDGFYNSDLETLFNVFGGTKFEEVLYKMNEEELIKSIRREILNTSCGLIVIEKIRCEDDWDSLRKILPAEPNECCVIVVTDEETLARYCVDDNEDQLIKVENALAATRNDIDALISLATCGRERDADWITRIWDRHPHLRTRQRIYDALINDCRLPQSPHVTSVWGIAGVGKSTLVKYSYTKSMLNPEKKLPRHNYYFWVDVPHPFSLAELSLRLLRTFFLDYYPSEYQERVMIGILEGDRDPIQECVLFLQQQFKARLLVLDGLCSTDDWDIINATFGLDSRGSTIVVTNDQHVAMHCANKNDKQMISVQGLDADEALNFFKEESEIQWKVRDYGLQCSDMARVWELVETILAKCGGLPKVIDAVAGYFRNYVPYDKQIDLRLEDINDNFMHILEGAHSLRGLFSWMQHYLESSEDYLKPCIFYLPVFPIGHNIRTTRLVMRWEAEGYNSDTSKQFYELWKSSMFQDQPSSKPAKIQVNGFIHEYISSRPMEDNLVFALEGSGSMGSQRAGGQQHLTIRTNWKRDINVFQSTDFSRLRSFTVFGKCQPWMFDPEKIKMRYVRVLDLEDAEGVTNDDLKNIVELFARLKFLSLRGQKEITRLPKSLDRLRQLETLDIRDTPVATLPEAILKLQSLQNVRAGTIHSAPWDEGGIMVPYQTLEDSAAPSPPAEVAATPSAATSDSEAPSAPASKDSSTPATVPRSRRPHALVPSWLSKVGSQSQISQDNTNNGVEVPAGIGKLTTLQNFGVANVGPGNNSATLKELHKLTLLCVISVCGINPDNIHQFFDAIKGLNHLDQLSVRLDKNRDDLIPCLDETIASPPKTLRERLKLLGHVRIGPGSWIKDFADVRILNLEVTLQDQDDMQVILDHLIHRTNNTTWTTTTRLCIKPIQGGELRIGINDENKVIGLKLDILDIVCTTNLKATIGNIGAVRVLRVECSTGSFLELSGLQAIRSLKEVWLKGSCSDELKQNMQHELDEREYESVLKVFQRRSS